MQTCNFKSHKLAIMHASPGRLFLLKQQSAPAVKREQPVPFVCKRKILMPPGTAYTACLRNDNTNKHPTVGPAAAPV